MLEHIKSSHEETTLQVREWKTGEEAHLVLTNTKGVEAKERKSKSTNN